MRAAILGATIDDIPKLLEYVRASSRLTHTDPKAEFGAVAVALAAREASQNDRVNPERWLELVSQALPSEAADLIEMLRSAIASVAKSESTLTYANALGLGRGVSGYTYHTVPVAIHCWLTYPDDFQRRWPQPSNVVVMQIRPRRSLVASSEHALVKMEFLPSGSATFGMAKKCQMDGIAWDGTVTGLVEFTCLSCSKRESDCCDPSESHLSGDRALPWFSSARPPYPEDAGFTNENHNQSRRCSYRAR